jgi:hypothetical protein
LNGGATGAKMYGIAAHFDGSHGVATMKGEPFGGFCDTVLDQRFGELDAPVVSSCGSVLQEEVCEPIWHFSHAKIEEQLQGGGKDPGDLRFRERRVLAAPLTRRAGIDQRFLGSERFALVAACAF